MIGGVSSRAILVIPKTAMDERSMGYAITFAGLVDATGVTMMFGRRASDDRRDGIHSPDSVSVRSPPSRQLKARH
jgi:aromatic ring hydroxylase